MRIFIIMSNIYMVFEVKFYDSFWIGDEYIYRFSKTGQLIQAIQPVNAVLPKDSSGALDFTSESDPRAMSQTTLSSPPWLENGSFHSAERQRKR